MVPDYRYYLQVITRIGKPVFSITNDEGNSSTPSLESYMAYGLGSGIGGRSLSQVPCSNASNRGIGLNECSSNILLACSQCSLVKYCSGRCQRQHWSKHRLVCEHRHLDPKWQPEWIDDGRKPFFSHPSTLPPSTSTDVYKNPGHPPYDILQLPYNESGNAIGSSFKICLTAAADIRNVIQTVNALPKGYSGKLDILVNNGNSLVLNRMLIVLCVLLNPGPSIEESAELATHLMCSAKLPETGASYVKYCANLIYGEELADGEMSFQTTLKTRGRGKLYSAQPAVGIKRPLEMVYSTYPLSKAASSMSEVLENPLHIDDRHRLLANLRPSHRIALSRFWDTGVLAPFSLELSSFKQPNRLMFGPQGEWLSDNPNPNPLHGWDISAVRRTGLRRGIDPSGDILGCLFFHIKSELREFSLRIKELNVNLHLTQYDSRVLSKGISIGVLPVFADAAFDRIDLGDMVDQVGLAECLADWGPLLNKKNPHASLIMHSKRWHEDIPGALARDNPRAAEVLMERCQSVPSLRSKVQSFLKSPQSPVLVRLMFSLDAFVDHEPSFLEYLRDQDAEATARSLGLAMRKANSVHPKRLGVPLDSPRQKVPNLSKEHYYNLFTIGAADLALRFAEFKVSFSE